MLSLIKLQNLRRIQKMEKIHLVSEEHGNRVYIKKFDDKIQITFNKYKAMSFDTIEEAQMTANIVNKAQGKRVYTVAIMQYFKELETVKINIDNDKIKVIIGIDILLFTKNNIKAYPKLMEVLNEVEGSKFKVWSCGTKIFEIEDKETLIKELVKFLSN